jgi:hypothetical protein
MKKTKLLSVLVGGVLTVGLAVGLAGCSSSENNDSGQKTAKVNPNKTHFTDKEISKYLKFVPNKNTKKTYAGIAYTDTWGKLVIDSPYKKINGTVTTLKGKEKTEVTYDGESYKTIEGAIPNVGKHLNVGYLVDTKDDESYLFEDYFNKKDVKVKATDPSLGYPVFYTSINGPKSATKLDWSKFINTYTLGREKKAINFIASDGHNIILANVSNDNILFWNIKNQKATLKGGSIDFKPKSNDLENDGHSRSKSGTFSTVDDVIKATDGLTVLYNGTDLK